MHNSVTKNPPVAVIISVAVMISVAVVISVAVIISVDSLLISYHVSKLAVNSWQPAF